LFLRVKKREKAYHHCLCFYYSGHGEFSLNLQSVRGTDPHIYGSDRRTLSYLKIAKILSVVPLNTNLVSVYDCCYAPNPGFSLEKAKVSDYVACLGKKEIKYAGVILTASLEFDTAEEISLKGKARGAFTSTLCDRLRVQDYWVSYEKLIEHVKQDEFCDHADLSTFYLETKEWFFMRTNTEVDKLRGSVSIELPKESKREEKSEEKTKIEEKSEEKTKIQDKSEEKTKIEVEEKTKMEEKSDEKMQEKPEKEKGKKNEKEKKKEKNKKEKSKKKKDQK